MVKDPFVSGAYDPRDDAQNRPLPSIDSIVQGALKKRRVQRSFGRPDSLPTREQVALTRRITGEKDD